MLRSIGYGIIPPLSMSPGHRKQNGRFRGEESMAVRLGDIIDDHCSRCHMIMDHSVVAIVGEEVKRVRCRTCNNEHDYKHGE